MICYTGMRVVGCHRKHRTAAGRPTRRQTLQLCHVSRTKQPEPTAPAPSATYPKLSKEEQNSLQAVLNATGLAEKASSSGRVPPQFVPDAVKQQVLSTIEKGVKKEVQDLQQLEGSMLLAEQLHFAAGGTQLNLSASPQGVDMWQPIFASSGGFPRLLYIPVPEYFDMHRALPDATAISIDPETTSIDVSSTRPYAEGAINIITELGPFTTHFLGSCRWLTGCDFQYAIDTVRIDFGGRTLKVPLGPFKLQNVLTFFLVTRELAAARSKLGGTMLLQANPAKGQRYFEAW